MDELVTIIIPVYKVEKYLKKCINSVITQTYSNLEIILVDDGSTDHCGEICDAFAEKDTRIKVIHKANGGLSDARNAGIDVMNGLYVVFIDSDDWVSKYYVENLYRAVKEGKTKLSTSWFIEVDEGDEAIPEAKVSRETEVLTAHDCLYRLFRQDGVEMSAWGKMYHRDLFENLRYPERKLYEDIPVTYRAIDLAEKVSVIKCVDYYYLQRENSIQYQKFNSNKMDAIVHMQELYEFVEKKYPDLRKAAVCRYFSTVCNLLFQVDNDSKKEKEILWKKICEFRKTVLFDNQARKKARIAAFLSYGGINGMKKIYTLTQRRG